jgi:hypothetical protein
MKGLDVTVGELSPCGFFGGSLCASSGHKSSVKLAHRTEWQSWPQQPHKLCSKESSEEGANDDDGGNHAKAAHPSSRPRSRLVHNTRLHGDAGGGNKRSQRRDRLIHLLEVAR